MFILITREQWWNSNNLFKDFRRDYLFPFYDSPRKLTKDDELTKSTRTKYHRKILRLENMPYGHTGHTIRSIIFQNPIGNAHLFFT